MASRLQAFVEEDSRGDFAFGVGLDVRVELWLESLDGAGREWSSLWEKTASCWDHEDEEATNHHHLEWCMQNADSLEPVEALETLHDDRQNNHSWRCHSDTRDNDLSDAGSSRQSWLADDISVLVLNLDSALQLVLSHHGNVDAVSHSDSGEGSVALEEWISALLQKALIAQRGNKSACRSRDISDSQLSGRRRWISISVCIVD